MTALPSLYTLHILETTNDISNTECGHAGIHTIQLTIATYADGIREGLLSRRYCPTHTFLLKTHHQPFMQASSFLIIPINLSLGNARSNTVCEHWNQNAGENTAT